MRLEDVGVIIQLLFKKRYELCIDECQCFGMNSILGLRQQFQYCMCISSVVADEVRYNYMARENGCNIIFVRWRMETYGSSESF